MTDQSERLLMKAAFFAEYQRNTAGRTARIHWHPADAWIELAAPPRQATPNVVQSLSTPKVWKAHGLGYLLTQGFQMHLFGDRDALRALGLEWYASCPAYVEGPALRAADAYQMLPASDRPDFLEWLAMQRQLVLLAHLLKMSDQDYARLKERAKAYHAALHRSRDDYNALLLAAEKAAEDAAAKLRERLQQLQHAERKVAVQEALLAKAPEEIAKLRQRSKYAVSDLIDMVPNIERELTTLRYQRDRASLAVDHARETLLKEQERFNTLREFARA